MPEKEKTRRKPNNAAVRGLRCARYATATLVMDKMEINLKKTSQFISIILAGILGSYLYSVQRAHSAEGFYIIYSTIAGLIMTWTGTISPWKWIPVLFVAYYLSGYAFNQNWGQFGPFDLIFMAIYSIPCLIASYALIYLRKFLTKNT